MNRTNGKFALFKFCGLMYYTISTTYRANATGPPVDVLKGRSAFRPEAFRLYTHTPLRHLGLQQNPKA